MDKFKIHVNEMVNTSLSIPHDDIYQYSDKGKVLWLQKLCFWILRNLKANYIERAVHSSVVTIDKNEALEYIINKVSTDFLYHNNCEYILVGGDVLTNLREHMRELSFYMPRAYRVEQRFGSGCHTRGTYMGLTIIYIPWMAGILPLPEKLGKILIPR